MDIILKMVGPIFAVKVVGMISSISTQANVLTLHLGTSHLKHRLKIQNELNMKQVMDILITIQG